MRIFLFGLICLLGSFNAFASGRSARSAEKIEEGAGASAPAHHILNEEDFERLGHLKYPYDPDENQENTARDEKNYANDLATLESLWKQKKISKKTFARTYLKDQKTSRKSVLTPFFHFCLVFLTKMQEKADRFVLPAILTPAALADRDRQEYEALSPYAQSFKHLCSAFLPIFEESKILNAEKASGFLPYPYDGTPPEGLLSLFYHRSEQNVYDLFFVDHHRDVYAKTCLAQHGHVQPFFIFKKGVLVNDSGLVVRVDPRADAPIVRLVAYNAEQRIKSPYAVHRSLEPLDDMLTDNLGRIFVSLMGDHFFKKEFVEKSHFLPLFFEDDLDQSMSCLLFLENLQEDLSGDNAEKAEQARAHIDVIEAETNEPFSTLLDNTKQQALDICKEKARREIIAQQEEISRRVAEQSIQGRPKGKKKPSAKTRRHQSTAAGAGAAGAGEASELTLEDRIQQRSQEIFKGIRQEGPIKYRSFLGLMRTIRNSFEGKRVQALFDDVRQKGSHLVFHRLEAPETVVIPHGPGDPKLSARTVNRFCQKLIDACMIHVARDGQL